MHACRLKKKRGSTLVVFRVVLFQMDTTLSDLELLYVETKVSRD